MEPAAASQSDRPTGPGAISRTDSISTPGSLKIFAEKKISVRTSITAHFGTELRHESEVPLSFPHSLAPTAPFLRGVR